MKPILPKSKLFVGIASKDEVEKTFAEIPWKPITYIYPPYSIITPPPTYMFTLGSGYASLATVTPFDIYYNSGIDVFRTDFDSKNTNEPLINIDHFVASKLNENQFAIYKDPTISYHWPTISSSIISEGVPPLWLPTVKMLLFKK